MILLDHSQIPLQIKKGFAHWYPNTHLIVSLSCWLMHCDLCYLCICHRRVHQGSLNISKKIWEARIYGWLACLKRHSHMINTFIIVRRQLHKLTWICFLNCAHNWIVVDFAQFPHIWFTLSLVITSSYFGCILITMSTVCHLCPAGEISHMTFI